MPDKNAYPHGREQCAGRVCDGQLSDCKRHGASRLVWSLVTVSLLWGASGCRAPRPAPSVAPVVVVEKRGLDLLKSGIKLNGAGWTSLDATCDVTIHNPAIPSIDNQLVFERGYFSFQKPGKVNLTVPMARGGGLKLVGDGSAYRVEIAGEAYRGAYGDSLSPAFRRIHFMPDDIADALDPSGLFWDRAQLLTQGAVRSQIHSVELIEEPEPWFRMTSTITIDRRREQNLIITKYDRDGSIRVHITYRTVQALTGLDDEPVEIPTTIELIYPEDPTGIRIELRSIKLHGELRPELFQVPR
ncbi:MAG: hypothetical protein KAX44_02250 [Candidatus Brocadiae bacterium]|nr:hypothetical protein [Candidatus Brocadiia bacterium]